MADRYVNLDPTFLVKLRAFEDGCRAHSLRLIAVEGYRDPKRSDALYADWKAGKSKIRAAPGGKSAHNYGLAEDYLCLDDGGKVIASSQAPEYALMEEIAPRYGLKTLRALNDGGHVELDGWEKLVHGV